jgi:hypothetical protein
MTKIGNYHKHVDNGGYTISVTVDEDYGFPSISMDASYFGYPNLSSELFGGSEMTPTDLRNIGMMFIEAAAKLETLTPTED